MRSVNIKQRNNTLYSKYYFFLLKFEFPTVAKAKGQAGVASLCLIIIFGFANYKSGGDLIVKLRE